MKDVNEITIENMVNEIFTTYNVKKKRKDIVEYYKNKSASDLFISPEDDTNATLGAAEIEKRVDAVLKEDKTSMDPYLTYSSPYYRKAKRKAKPINPIGQSCVDPNYIGKAGECMVMGELLFRGYNVNHMLVDEGVDVVASKENMFFYIQVKTSTVSQQNRFYFKIKQDRFIAYVDTQQMRYFLVGRYMQGKEVSTIYFQFSSRDLQRLMSNGCIPVPETDLLSIKIEFDDRVGKAYIYHNNNRQNIDYHTNNFDL